MTGQEKRQVSLALYSWALRSKVHLTLQQVDSLAEEVGRLHRLLAASEADGTPAVLEEAPAATGN